MVVAGVVTLAAPQICGAQEPVSNAPVAPSAVTNHSLIPGPVEVAPAPQVEAGMPCDWRVGTRYLHYSLQDKHRGTEFNGSFVGTLTELKDKQDNIPDRLFAQGRVMDWPVWIGVSYDRVLATTWEGNRPAGKPAGASDGDVELRGAIPYVQGAWENRTRFAPYIEAGLSFYQSKFDALSNWSNGGERQISLGNAKGFEIAGGTGISIYKNWSADLYARYMHIDDVTGTFYEDGSKQDNVIFTMSYVAFGVGVTYGF